MENREPSVLDVAVQEATCRVRMEHGAETFAVLRRMARNLLQQATTTTVGTKAKRRKAGWDDAYLFRLLTTYDAIALRSHASHAEGMDET